MPSEERYLTASQVRERFGQISDMSLWRWLRDPRMGFPRPIKINQRRLFKESELIAWEARHRMEA